MSLLNEFPFIEGSVSSTDRMAYVEQLTEIFNGKIKDLIRFGKPYDAERLL